MNIDSFQNRWQLEAYNKGKFIGPIQHDKKTGYFGPCGRFFEVDKYITRKKNFGSAWIYKGDSKLVEFMDEDHGGYILSLKAALAHSHKCRFEKINAIRSATTIVRAGNIVTQIDIDKIVIRRDDIAKVHRVSLFSDIERKLYTYEAIPFQSTIKDVEKMLLDIYRARLKANVKFRYKYTVQEYFDIIELYLANQL